MPLCPGTNSNSVRRRGTFWSQKDCLLHVTMMAIFMMLLIWPSLSQHWGLLLWNFSLKTLREEQTSGMTKVCTAPWTVVTLNCTTTASCSILISIALGRWLGLAPIPEARTMEALECRLKEKSGFLKFIRRTLTWIPEERATAKELLQDPWLTGGDS